jgi:hypothetical protein
MLYSCGFAGGTSIEASNREFESRHPLSLHNQSLMKVEDTKRSK